MKELGVKRGTVKLIAHQDEWHKEADRTIKELKHLFGNTAIDIQHIGSTAIPSIHAKPIIDIAVGVCDLNDIKPYVELLRENGSDGWNNYINFRDYLNVFPHKAMIYDDLKQKLSVQFSEERRRYTEGKQQIIGNLLEEARLWRSKQ